MSKRITAGTGISLGALLALPAAAQADDFQVTNLNDSGAGSLREAIEDAEANAGADRVVFKSKLSGTIELSAGDRLEITDDLEIRGPGARQLTVTYAGTGSILAPQNIIPLTDGSPIDITVSGLTLAGSTSDDNGGAIAAYAFDGTIDLTLSRMTIADNTATGTSVADGLGGGVSALGAEGVNLTIESSTISGNSAAEDGGGVFLGEGELLIVNSTLSGNVAGDRGGGLYTGEPDIETTVIRSSTITDNRAANGGGISEDQDGATLRNSIIAGNSAPDYPDLNNGPWDTSFSLIGSTSAGGGLTPVDIDDEGGNLLNVDPKLKPLKNNGGPTDTHAIKKSPAKNAGPSDAPDKDQRGAPRKGQPDVGAYEFTKCKGVVVNRVGTSGKDKLKGTKKKDGMLGLGGNDKLKGKKGKDGLCGGRGKDKLIGGPGKDKFNGGPGKDKERQ